MAKHVELARGRRRGARLLRPADLADLAAFLAHAARAASRCCFVGLGSNLLVRDGGFRGTVVLMHNRRRRDARRGRSASTPRRASPAPEVARVRGDARLRRARSSSPAFRHGRRRARDERRLLRRRRPGTSSPGSQTINRARAGCASGAADEFEIGYRHARAARIEAERRGRVVRRRAVPASAPGTEKLARKRIKELLAQRLATQPLELPNAGSVFRNPPGDHAARLIEAAGLKGRDDRRRAHLREAREFHRQSRRAGRAPRTSRR